jgi:hypothetical protein
VVDRADRLHEPANNAALEDAGAQRVRPPSPVATPVETKITAPQEACEQG